MTTWILTTKKNYFKNYVIDFIFVYNKKWICPFFLVCSTINDTINNTSHITCTLCNEVFFLFFSIIIFHSFISFHALKSRWWIWICRMLKKFSVKKKVKEARKKNRVYKKDKRSTRKINCAYEFSRTFRLWAFI